MPAASAAIRCTEFARDPRTASRSRSTCSSRKRSPMSAKSTTAPRPSAISIGTDTYETGNLEPSRRKNQSKSRATVWPAVRGSCIGHSAAG